MLEESELNTREVGVDQLLNRSSNEIVDGLLDRHDGIASNALNELQQKIEDGYTSREILLAKQKLEDILEKSKNMSKTRKFMEDIFNQISLREDETVKKIYAPKIDRGENKKLNYLIDNGIPPSVLLNNKQLIFKTNIGIAGNKYLQQDQSGRVQEIEKRLQSPFLRASDRAALKQELNSIKSNANNYYMFRVVDVKPDGVITKNYHHGMQPEEVKLTFNQLFNIMDEPINAKNTAIAFEHFPEAKSKSSWKTTIYGSQPDIKHNYFLWYQENKDRYDLDNYNRYEKAFIFKCNKFFDYSIEQAIRFLKATGKLDDYLTDRQITSAIRDAKNKLMKNEALAEEEGDIYRMKTNSTPENLQKMKDFIKEKHLDRKLIEMPFEVKTDTSNLKKEQFYEIVGTPVDTDDNTIIVKSLLKDDNYGQEKTISIDELKYALNLLGEHKYLLTSDHSIQNIEKIREYLKNIGINPKYIDMPFIYKPEVKINKWAQKGNNSYYKPTEHRYVITGIPDNSEVKTLKLKEILPTGMRTDPVEMPIETVKSAIEANPTVDYNTMIDPKNGEVIDIPLDPKLRAATYVHGIQGTFYPLTEENVKGLLQLAQKLIAIDRKPLYVNDLVRSYENGTNDLEVKEAMKDIWSTLKIKNFLQVKNVDGKLKFYYTLGDAFLRTDGTSRMIKQARHKEGKF